MKIDEMQTAIEDAEDTLRRANGIVDILANMLIGRLRQVTSGGRLAALKKELKNFDSRTHEWKD